MSAVIYPVGCIEELSVTPMDSTVADQFEAGNTATRRLWPAQSFKRKFKLTHAPLNVTEQRYLRSFYSQRSGKADSFWFRDNVNREGNSQVRFSKELDDDRKAQVWRPQIEMEQIEVVRCLPQFDEMAAAAGIAPFIWLEANREMYISHAGSIVTQPDGTIWDNQGQYSSAWAGMSIDLRNVTGQYQHYRFAGAGAARSAVNPSSPGAGQVACTLFAIVRQSSTATAQVLMTIGGPGNGEALGIALSAANKYTPYIGGAATWTNGNFTNSAADTWRSVAVTFASGSNSASLYVNAALIGTDAGNARSHVLGKFAMGAAADLTAPANPSNAMTNCDFGHGLCFAGELTLAQIKAVHNLIGYQFGLAVVP